MTKQPSDSEQYRKKKAFLRSLLTVYGRKPVLEALQSADIKPYRLHLADSNKPAEILDQIITLASKCGAEVLYHSKQELARLSKNSRQDQGVCIDLHCPGFADFDEFMANHKNKPFELIALDGVTNPQNLGMIIRSVTAGWIDGILLPEKGTAQIDPLVIKASAGTVFKARIIRCENLADSLKFCQQLGVKVVCLSGSGSSSLDHINRHAGKIFVLGNETEGVSKEVSALADHSLAIAMNNGVESLNVAVTAALLAFRMRLPSC